MLENPPSTLQLQDNSREDTPLVISQGINKRDLSKNNKENAPPPLDKYKYT